MSAELRTPPGRKGRATAEEAALRPRQLSTASDSVPAASAAPQRTGRKLVRMAFWGVQIALAIGLGYWIAYARAQQDTRIALPSEHVRSDVEREAVAVTVAPVARRSMERSIDAVGSLYGYDELTLKTKISGRVAKIYHDFADRVEPGALLLEIDPTDSQLAVEQAKRSLNSELAKWGFQGVPEPNTDLSQLPTVVGAKVRLDLAKSQLSRLSSLQSRGSVTADELEQAKTTALVAESDYANQLLLARAGAANALLKKSELDIAEQQLRETKLYVPLREAVGDLRSAHYTITERYVTEGAWLAAGSDLFRLVVDDTLKLRLSIPEKHAASVRVGQRVEVSTLTVAKPVIGQVTRIGPAVDPETRTFQIEAEVPNLDGGLKTGGFAKGRVIIDAESNAVTVPTSALVTFAGVHKVFVLRDDRVAEHQVKLGEQTAEWVELVDSQLPVDARVVTSGQSQLADGSLVRLREPERNATVSDVSDSRANAKVDEKNISNANSPGSDTAR